MVKKILSGTLLFVLVLAALLVVSCGGTAPESSPAVPTSPTPPPSSAVPAPPTPPQSPENISQQEVKPVIKTYSSPPPMSIDTDKKYTAVIETEKGSLMLELFAKDVPVTVNNFVFLANEGFYDGCTFHRVIPGFMAQGGDPTGTGMGGPGYFIDNEITEHTHVAGALSMANAGADTNGCQFFITYAPKHNLDGDYSVFGQLVEGKDVLEKLTPRDPSRNPQFEGDRIIRIFLIIE